ncbi:MAG: hypothetical protein P8130_04605 [Deltaproteobacteria bacterium]
MNRRILGKLWLAVFFVGYVVASSSTVMALTNADCLDCHGDPGLSTVRNGKKISLYIDGARFKASVHGQNGCISCHEDAGVAGDEHPVPLGKVVCANCHDEVAARFGRSVHGKRLAAGDKFAPHCYDCHTRHSILPASNSKSTTFILNIPFTCGSCHVEGSPMTKGHKIPVKNILENYSMSIHGEGLFRMGLKVTAVCTSCHSAHDILPPENPKSTISRLNVVKTCMKCHSNIEKVHIKIVRGQLWEQEPKEIPVCVECHAPHRVQRFVYVGLMNNLFCLGCHGDKNLKQTEPNGTVRSLYVDVKTMQHSIHEKKHITCVKCHINVSHAKNPVCKDSGRVDCSICHAEITKLYDASIHGTLHAKGDPNAPVCTDCHGSHDILTHEDQSSPTFPRNIPDLCARCHRKGEKAALRYTGSQHEIVKHYLMSIHGQALTQAGLMISATCISCHTAHSMLPASDPRSSVNPDHVIHTCGKCHLGIADKFKKSIHSALVTKTKKKLPVCNTCHTSHTILRVDLPAFRRLILKECGTCHKYETKTYFETIHGKASLLSGGARAAKCSDCHGAHDIQPSYNLNSRLNPRNIEATCRKCHPDTNRQFTGYLTHATHHNRNKYPYLFYTYWAMTSLLIVTFTFFGIHNLFWLSRSFRERFKKRREHSREKWPDK